MTANPYSRPPLGSYRSTSVATADKGKLILIVYDHCLKWLGQAQEELARKDLAKMVKAVHRAQDGLTELMCSLNFEEGGDIAKNLFRLYDFYSWHLTQAIVQRSGKPLEDVTQMMTSLKEAWVVAIETVRKDDRGLLSERASNQLSMVG